MDISRLSKKELEDLRNSLVIIVNRENKTISVIDRRLAEIKAFEGVERQDNEPARLQR